MNRDIRMATLQEGFRFFTQYFGTYVPRAYSQKELLNNKIFVNNSFVKSIAMNGRIDYRCFSENPEEIVEKQCLEYANGYLRQHAPEMALKALKAAVGQDKDNDPDLGFIEALIVVNATGFMIPGISGILGAKHGVGNRETLRFDLNGQGCFGAIAGVQLAQALLLSNQVNSVATVFTEPMGGMFNPSPDDNSSLLPFLIFGEGAAAMVFSNEKENSNSILPRFVFAVSEQDGRSIDHVSVTQNNASWKIRIDLKVPDTGLSLVSNSIRRVLEKAGLRNEDIQHWIFHTGGKAILEKCQSGLGLSDEQMKHNFENLRKYGNTQSASVLFSLQELLDARQPCAGDLGLLVAIGPGMTAGAYLLSWPEN